jgi:hypothetical protein
VIKKTPEGYVLVDKRGDVISGPAPSRGKLIDMRKKAIRREHHEALRAGLLLCLLLPGAAGAQAFGARQWKQPVSNAAALPTCNSGSDGHARVTLDTGAVHVCLNGTGWVDQTSGGGGGTDDQVAAEVPFTPAGGIAATDVQAALEEVDAEHTVDTDTTCLDAGVDCLFAASVSEGGAATTATALAADGGNCSAGEYPLGVDAAGAVQSCTPDDTGTDDQTATEVGYTPTTGTDWVDPDPSEVGGALDDVAGRVTTLEGAGGGIGGSTGSTDNAVLRADGTGGSTVQASGVVIDDSDNLTLPDAAGPALLNETPTTTNPDIVPNKTDGDTGIGWSAADSFSLVSGGVELVRLTETGGNPFVNVGAAATASAELEVTGSRSGLPPLRIRHTLGTSSGWAGIEYQTSADATAVFTGYNNGTKEFRFNNVASGGYIDFLIGSSSKLKIQNNGTVHFGAIATAPATCTIGDFYVDTSGAYCACTSTDTWTNLTPLTGACS